MRNIQQNLFFSFIYNAAGVPIALYPNLRDHAVADRRGRGHGAVIGCSAIAEVWAGGGPK